MLTNLDTHVDPAELDTPWEPQEIVWRYPMSTRRDDIIYQTSIQPSHIVREVAVQSPLNGRQVRSIEEVKASLDHTKEQFEAMADCGILIPEVNWYSFEDCREVVRTLARIAIIKGPTPNFATDDEFYASVSGYVMHSMVKGPKLSDVTSVDQYRYGTPKAPDENTVLIPQLYFVDIESRFSL